MYLDRKIQRLERKKAEAIANEMIEKRVAILDKVDDNVWGYEVGEVWTSANNPKYTIKIIQIHPKGMVVEVTDGDSVDRIYFTECGRGDEDNYYDVQLTVLKREG